MLSPWWIPLRLANLITYVPGGKNKLAMFAKHAKRSAVCGVVVVVVFGRMSVDGCGHWHYHSISHINKAGQTLNRLAGLADGMSA